MFQKNLKNNLYSFQDYQETPKHNSETIFSNNDLYSIFPKELETTFDSSSLRNSMKSNDLDYLMENIYYGINFELSPEKLVKKINLSQNLDEEKILALRKNQNFLKIDSYVSDFTSENIDMLSDDLNYKFCNYNSKLKSKSENYNIKNFLVKPNSNDLKCLYNLKKDFDLYFFYENDKLKQTNHTNEKKTNTTNNNDINEIYDNLSCSLIEKKKNETKSNVPEFKKKLEKDICLFHNQNIDIKQGDFHKLNNKLFDNDFEILIQCNDKGFYDKNKLHQNTSVLTPKSNSEMNKLTSKKNQNFQSFEIYKTSESKNLNQNNLKLNNYNNYENNDLNDVQKLNNDFNEFNTFLTLNDNNLEIFNILNNEFIEFNVHNEKKDILKLKKKSKAQNINAQNPIYFQGFFKSDFLESQIKEQFFLRFSVNEIKHLKLMNSDIYCNHCSVKFTNYFELIDHFFNFKLSFDLRNHKCPVKECAMNIVGFPRKAELRHHIVILHFEKGRIISKYINYEKDLQSTIYVCRNKNCEKGFYRKDSLLRHVKLVHDNQNSKFNKTNKRKNYRGFLHF